MAAGLTLKEQPGLDAEFTKNRFKDQVILIHQILIQGVPRNMTVGEWF